MCPSQRCVWRLRGVIYRLQNSCMHLWVLAQWLTAWNVICLWATVWQHVLGSGLFSNVFWVLCWIQEWYNSSKYGKFDLLVVWIRISVPDTVTIGWRSQYGTQWNYHSKTLSGIFFNSENEYCTSLLFFFFFCLQGAWFEMFFCCWLLNIETYFKGSESWLRRSLLKEQSPMTRRRKSRLPSVSP